MGFAALDSGGILVSGRRWGDRVRMLCHGASAQLSWCCSVMSQLFSSVGLDAATAISRSLPSMFLRDE